MPAQFGSTPAVLPDRSFSTKMCCIWVQITIWGTSANGDSEVNDYANKEWAGLISGFYHPRCNDLAFSLSSCVRTFVLGPAVGASVGLIRAFWAGAE